VLAAEGFAAAATSTSAPTSDAILLSHADMDPLSPHPGRRRYRFRAHHNEARNPLPRTAFRRAEGITHPYCLNSSSALARRHRISSSCCLLSLGSSPLVLIGDFTPCVVIILLKRLQLSHSHK
jgi:hypothetical protein